MAPCRLPAAAQLIRSLPHSEEASSDFRRRSRRNQSETRNGDPSSVTPTLSLERTRASVTRAQRSVSMKLDLNNTGGMRSRANLHAIVLDYVTHHGYLETARELAIPESSRSAAARTNGNAMEIDGDLGGNVKLETDSAEVTPEMLADVERRRRIIDHILNGAITQAIDALNTHYPELLASGKPSSFGSSTHKRPESPNNSSNGHANGNETATNHILPVFHLSLNPDHIRLNLQIQQFIELFRRPSTPSSPSSSNGSISDSNGSGVTHSLATAQSLHSEVNKLQPEDHSVYMQEVKDVGALLAYIHPETSILKGFLDQARRIALAEQVNKAMLHHRGQRTTTLLDGCVRRTSQSLKVMDHYGLSVIPPWTAADGPECETLASYIKFKGGFDLEDFARA